MIELSILICTMPKRSDMFEALMNKICIQAFECGAVNDIEILHDANMNYNVGIKRNLLLKRAKGKYIVYIDDDDVISEDYLSKILEACKHDCDCIGISGTMTTNKVDLRQWHISKDFGLPWSEKNRVYYRTPNHISPVKRGLALQAGFPNISFAEDAGYSQRLFPLLKTETKIEGNIYYYDYITNK